ncbi:hypothetical protein SAMN06297387_11445 [Streptomyces zhaozhouensis]|uniref:Uncharacterized protein n=1 Tax=Streptomyces zhaozhouensis TaxID=1300267 RepID=A0A286DZI6_9ACTN|nr:hypothetical protein [Streptomyces zhaozhouensis]SOD64065.1 hypothetical protein SAMN06297387_11445 [Streptomyces zhaozhouensis]
MGWFEGFADAGDFGAERSRDRRPRPGRRRPAGGRRAARRRPWPSRPPGARPEEGPPTPADHPRYVWARGTRLLAEAGRCPRCGAPQRRCAFARAAGLLRWLWERAGPGEHHLVCSVLLPDTTLSASLGLRPAASGGGRAFGEEEAAVFCAVLAAGLVSGASGGLVLRTAEEPPRQSVRGWRLTAGRLVPLSEAQVFAAYCTDPTSGEPLPPEPDVDYRASPRPPTGDCPGPAEPAPPG